MGSKRCAVCNHLNEEGRIYCRFCRAFLGADTGQKIVRKKSIWEIREGQIENEEMERMPFLPKAGEREKKIQADEESGWLFICPVCGRQYPSAGGNRPLLCTACSYFFTEEDKPVQRQRAAEKEKLRQPDRTEEKEISFRRQNTGPMRRRGEDISSMRLIGLSENAPFVLNVSEKGSILGSNGNLRPELFRSGRFRKVMPQHLMIWHTQAGWYLRALKGRTLYNGEEMNLGVCRRLADGDFLNAGDCSIRVEITRGRKND